MNFSFFRWLFTASNVLLLVLLVPLCEGQSWERRGPLGGNVVSLAIAHDVVYLGTPDGHIFASADRGQHWEMRGRVASRLDGVVQKIVPDTNRDRLLAAVWFQDPTQGGGVFETLDGARHWSPAGLTGEAVRALEHSPSNPRVWVAGTRSGVFRSGDNARSWQRITRADDRELQNVDSLAIDPLNPEIIYVGTYHLPWKTQDAGETWAPIASGMIDDSDVMSLLVDSKNPRRIFSSACSGIYRTDDAGLSWTKLQGIPYASRRTQQIVQDPKNSSILYAATTQGLWQSSDSGENWKRITPPETVANAVVLLSRENSTRILVGMEAQGVLRSDNQATSFSESNEGFSHRVISSIAADPREPSHLLARVEGFTGKLMETKDGGASWNELPRGAPPQPVGRIYSTSSGWWISFTSRGLARFDTAKGNWTIVKFRAELRGTAPGRKSPARARPASRPTRRPRTASPHVSSLVEVSEKTLVATDDGLWASDRPDDEFKRIKVSGLPQSISYLSSSSQASEAQNSRTQKSVLAIASNAVWVSDDRNASKWRQLSSPQNAGRLLWIEELIQNESRIRLVGAQNGVFVAENDGTWRLVSNGLPTLASAPMSVSGSMWLLAMSNGGIYRTGGMGKSWQRIDTETERGGVTSVLPDGEGGFFVASQSEGLLHLALSDRERH